MVLVRARHLFWRLLFLDMVCVALKITVQRARPYQKDGTAKLDLLPYASFDTAFPSGHTAYATFLATNVARKYGGRASVIAYTTAAAVAVSRVQLRMHHVSDVLVAAVLGGGIANVSSSLFRNRFI